MDETFKYFILHYVNKVLLVFMKFKENQNSRSVRGDLEISEILELIWHVEPTTYRISNIQSRASESEILSLLCAESGTPRKCYPWGDLK